MKFRAIDLSRITPEDLVRNPRPIADWPTLDLDPDEVQERASVASWKWDISSIEDVSNRLSECAWDALHLGFSYLFCDVVALEQDDPDITGQLVAFSDLYETLHTVVSYTVDPDIKRAWLKNEAYRILRSPTNIAYIAHKWRLRVPLISSLIIKQVCMRRLGLPAINEERLQLCDTEAARTLSLRDLRLFDDIDLSMGQVETINLDRRRQKFASDVLLVYELSLPSKRAALIEPLRKLRSNCVGIPALIVIWALLEGLSVSVRGCDWDIKAITALTVDVLREAARGSAGLTVKLDDEVNRVLLEGPIDAQLQWEIAEVPYGLSVEHDQYLLVRCRDGRARTQEKSLLCAILESSVRYVQSAMQTGALPEPLPLREGSPQYEIDFDDYIGSCSDRTSPRTA